MVPPLPSIQRSPAVTISGGILDSASSSRAWTLDLRARDLYSPDGAWVHLTSYEFRLLAEMVSEPNQTFDRNRILMALADRDWSPRDRSIDVLVSKLRKKIEADAHRPTAILTVHGLGYRYDPPD